MNRYQAHPIKRKGVTMSDQSGRLLMVSAILAVISVMFLGISIGLLATTVIR